MITQPNTSNQIRIEDTEGDILMVDVMSDGEVVFTTRATGGRYIAVLVTPDEAAAIVEHLKRWGASS